MGVVGLRWVSSSPNLGFLSLNKGRKADEPMTLDKGVLCPSLALDLWEPSTVWGLTDKACCVRRVRKKLEDWPSLSSVCSPFSPVCHGSV